MTGRWRTSSRCRMKLRRRSPVCFRPSSPCSQPRPAGIHPSPRPTKPISRPATTIGNRRQENVVRTKEYYEQAIALDPDFALARAVYAEYFLLQASIGGRRTGSCRWRATRRNARWSSIRPCRKRTRCWESWREDMSATGKRRSGDSGWPWLATPFQRWLWLGTHSFTSCRGANESRQ